MTKTETCFRICRLAELEGPTQIWAVTRALRTLTAPIEHMCIDHGRTDILVPEQFLNRSDIIPVL